VWAKGEAIGRDLNCPEDPLWELSSPSEAAKAAALSEQWLADPPLSQPRQGSTAPTLDPGHPELAGVWANGEATGRDLNCPENPLWELSSPSEAAKVAALSEQWSADPPLSQPR
jgi:hypothetical protein